MILDRMAAAKKFINNPEDAVSEMVDGVLLTTPGLRKLSGHTVLVRSDIEVVR